MADSRVQWGILAVQLVEKTSSFFFPSGSLLLFLSLKPGALLLLHLQVSESMSSGSKVWMVAGTVGLVEALKDQGFARWNTTIRSIHHHAKSNLRSISHTKNLPQPAAMASSRAMEEKAKRSEDSLRKVMYLSCWGPN
uniref:Wound-responsive family protein n=2 Tax=Lactuca sativa TaxID=4236 RepID=A0A9R1XKN7_LACSA|nr:hypothetical protein LSAT_V11C300117420 [Lactuca sativa]